MSRLPTPQEVSAELCRRDFLAFVRAVRPDLQTENFHAAYYRLLDRFARGEIRRLIVTMPPQHGKSLAASQLLPAYLLGLNPELHVCVAAYSFALARRFGSAVQRVMAASAYRDAFPGTRLKGPGKNAGQDGCVRTQEEFDIPGHEGNFRTVGREGALTGHRVDVMVLDDIYKDALEANSPVIRENAREWYNAVVRTRLHDGSRELIAFTRWHEDDLIGTLEKTEPVVELNVPDPLLDLPPGTWLKVNFPALKTGKPTALDPRPPGTPLWESRHGKAALLARRKLDPGIFEALYQGAPSCRENRLYPPFETYEALPTDIVAVANYTDTADTGTDNLCSICYVKDPQNRCYVIDVVYTDLSQEKTEEAVAEMLNRNRIRVARIESNNGGRGFARALERLVDCTRILTFHQSRNKEARILSNAWSVNRFVRMPRGWEGRWPRLAEDLVLFRRNVRSNRTDDAADVLTGIVETECFPDPVPDRHFKKIGFKI